MPQRLPTHVKMVVVNPHDELQNEAKTVPAATKIAVIKLCCAALAAVAVASFSAGSAVAQTNEYLHSISLTDGDIELFRAMDFAIFDDRWPTKGRTMKWSNEQTGNAGTVSILDLFERDGRTCRRVEHRIARKGYADPVVFQLARCLSRDGATWEPL